MADLVNVAVDAMGGDNAPLEIVKGCVEAINDKDGFLVTLIGNKEAVEAELAKYSYPKERVEVYPSTEVIEMAEPPVNAIRRKKDSSIVRGMYLVREGKCDAFISGGSTGAILVGGQVIVGRINGIERPPLAPLIPTKSGYALLADCGANMDAKPSQLVQFAKLGSIYMKNFMGIENPKVGIVNVGAEEEKGNMLVKETFPLLKECKDINFIGSIEARDIPAGVCDVIICDAFVGNVILKLYEGTAGMLVSVIKDGMKSNLRSQIGGLLVKPALKKTLKGFSLADYGGAPLLGLKGLVVKVHGSSKSIEVKHAIYQCVDFNRNQINDIIRESFAKTEIQEEGTN